MSEPKFTRSRTVWIGGDGRQFIVDAENPAHVISEYPHATERHVADAALDLAAPDLYEAAYIDSLADGPDWREMAQECRTRHAELYKEAGKEEYLEVPDKVRWVARRLRSAALAKARGEATQ